MFAECADRIQPARTLSEDLLQIAVRLLRPVNERRLHCQIDVIPLTDRNLLRSRQTCMDDRMSVIFSGQIVKRRLDGTHRLHKRLIADRVHPDLQTGAVCRLTEFRHFFIRIVEYAAVRRVFIRREQCRIHGTEASVKRCLKTAPDSRKLPLYRLIHIERLHKHAHLHAVCDAARKKTLQIDVQISRKADAADRMDHADAARSQIVQRLLHVRHQLHRRERSCDIIRDGEKCLLVHLPGILMKTAQMLHLAAHFV